MKKSLLLLLLAWSGWQVSAQKLPDLKLPLPHDSTLLDVRTTDFPVMKELYFTPILGAPVLGGPMRVDGTVREIRTEEHGLAYPTLFDWNRDGKPDLLVGEFLTGQSRIKVYLNVGTKKKPKFTGEWFYATDVNGDVISNYQWCCIGIHPQVVDVDGDGYPDLFSGQYYPGVVTWWRGGEKGFEPGRPIPQLGYQDGKEFGMNEPVWSVESWWYWNYSSARLADFDGDGLLDLFVGGCGGYRVALNTGTKEEPSFGRREFLYHVDGTILHTRRNPEVKVETGKDFHAEGACSMTAHCYLNPVDWDGDGVLDIIATDEYTREGELGIYFLRGVMTDDGLRFEHARPLFLAPDGSKALPGCTPHIQVVDYNGDGVQDILMGLSIPTINGFEGAAELYWRYTGDLGLNSPGKDTGESLQYYESIDDLQEKVDKKMLPKEALIGKLDDWKYLTLRHRGYVFLFPGRENRQKAVAVPMKAGRREFEYDKPAKKEYRQGVEKKEAVSCLVRSRKIYNEEDFEITVHFETTGSYHLYTKNKMNENQVPVSIEITLPEGMSKVGEMKLPPVKLHGANEVYDGKILTFSQRVKAVPGMTGKVEVKVKVTYQTCSDETCLPLVEKEQTIEIVF